MSAGPASPGGGKSGGGKKRGGGRAGGRATGTRMLRERVRTARGRRPSSTRWLDRQLNDPYVIEAKRLGLSSRAAFKLMQLDDRFHFLGPGMKVVDLGAAPGGWTQVAAQRVKAGEPKGGKVAGIDILEWTAPPGATALVLDFLDPSAPRKLQDAIGSAADVVLSDMASPATGHRPTDHIRIVALCEAAIAFAIDVLKPGGAFVCKVFKGGTEKVLLDELKQRFNSVRHAKPPASRAESAETYVVALGFKGRSTA
jgi:23S rRNA (uridine2552-2'-O)-methyltransferase